MTQDYSVEIFGPEEPDATATPGGQQAARTHEVSDRRARAIAEVEGGLSLVR
jgi:hypothetical protein